MRVPTALAAAFAVALTACGDGGDAPDGSVEAPPEAVRGTEAEVAADAALADRAARAEAEDAAIGGNVEPEDVSAAGNVTLNAIGEGARLP